MTNSRQFDYPNTYVIRVKGRLDHKWSDWFGGLTIINLADDETELTGLVADQAALHGLLNKLRDLGLPLLSVQRLNDMKPQESGGSLV
jgi:hypothetical protein